MGYDVNIGCVPHGYCEALVKNRHYRSADLGCSFMIMASLLTPTTPSSTPRIMLAIEHAQFQKLGEGGSEILEELVLIPRVLTGMFAEGAVAHELHVRGEHGECACPSICELVSPFPPASTSSHRHGQHVRHSHPRGDAA